MFAESVPDSIRLGEAELRLPSLSQTRSGLGEAELSLLSLAHFRIRYFRGAKGDVVCRVCPRLDSAWESGVAVAESVPDSIRLHSQKIIEPETQSR